MKKLFFCLFLTGIATAPLMAQEAGENMQALAVITDVESDEQGKRYAIFNASVSNFIRLNGERVEVDPSASATQRNASVRAGVRAKINADTPDTITSDNDVILAGGFVN